MVKFKEASVRVNYRDSTTRMIEYTVSNEAAKQIIYVKRKDEIWEPQNEKEKREFKDVTPLVNNLIRLYGV